MTEISEHLNKYEKEGHNNIFSLEKYEEILQKLKSVIEAKFSGTEFLISKETSSINFPTRVVEAKRVLDFVNEIQIPNNINLKGICILSPNTEFEPYTGTLYISPGSGLDKVNQVLLGSESVENEIATNDDTVYSINKYPKSTIRALNDFIEKYIDEGSLSGDPDLRMNGDDEVLIPSVAPLIEVLSNAITYNKRDGVNINIPKHVFIQRGEEASYDEKTKTLKVGSRAKEETIFEALSGRNVEDVAKDIANNVVLETEPQKELNSEVSNSVVNKPEPPKLEQVQGADPLIGKYVQWTNQGVDQFTEAKKVGRVESGPDGNKYIFVEGGTIGIPIEQITEVDASQINKINLVQSEPIPEPIPQVESNPVVEKKENVELSENKEITEGLKKIEIKLSELEAKLEDIRIEQKGERFRDRLKRYGIKAGEKSSEALRTVASIKTMQWYMGLTRTQRFALNAGLIGIGTVVGTAVGGATAVGALGYGGYRVARATASFGASTIANRVVASKEKKLDKEFEAKMKELEESYHSENQKEIYRNTLKEDYETRKKRLAKIKMASTIAAGMGTGFLAGVAEHALAGGASIAETALSARPKVADQNFNGGVKPELVEHPVPAPAMPAPNFETQSFLNIKPEDMKVHIEKGDSVWGSLRKVLEKNDDFAQMTTPQQETVIANFTNIALKNPTEYGIGADLVIHPNDTLDFSKLFENEENVKSIFDHSISIHNETPEQLAQYEHNLNNNEGAPSGQEEGADTSPESSLDDDLKEKVPKRKFPSIEELLGQIKENQDTSPSQTVVESWEPSVPDDGDSTPLPVETHPQVDDNLAKSVDSVINGAVSPEEIDSAVKNGVNSIYGSEGVFGIGAVEGLQSKEWQFIQNLKMADVLKYFHGDSSESTLSPEIIKSLTKSDKHFDFVKEIDGIIANSKSALKPFENESVGEFLRRAVGFSLKQGKILPQTA